MFLTIGIACGGGLESLTFVPFANPIVPDGSYRSGGSIGGPCQGGPFAPSPECFAVGGID